MNNRTFPKPGGIVIEGHVQGLSNTRSLGEAGIPVFVVDTGDCIARHSKYCRAFYKCPPFDSDAFAHFLIELARAHHLDGWLLLPSNDHAVLTISRNKKRLEAWFKVITPGIEIIGRICDKSRLLRIAMDAGVPVPDTYYAADARPQNTGLRFPVITKGRLGRDFYAATGRKAFLAANLAQLQDQLAQIQTRFPIEKTFTQEVIPDDGTNKTVSFTAFCVDGKIKTCWMGVKLREHPLRFGTATFARSVYVEECRKRSTPLLQALNYTGVCEVEYLKDPRDGLYKLIEINPRTWLWVELAKACGVDYAKIMYAYANGWKVAYPNKYRTKLCWQNPLSDMAFAVKAMAQGLLNPLKYINSIGLGKSVSFFFNRDDPKPGIMYFLNIPSYLKNR